MQKLKMKATKSITFKKSSFYIYCTGRICYCISKPGSDKRTV